jgi:transcriptional regulator with XRE-family HTH domain
MLSERVVDNLNFLVKQARKHGYKDYETAAMIGVSPSQLTRWLSGKSQMTIGSIESVLGWYARFCEKHEAPAVNAADFFGGLLIWEG